MPPPEYTASSTSAVSVRPSAPRRSQADLALRLLGGTGELGPHELRAETAGAGPRPSELRNAQVEPIVRKYLELRYRLLPYTYTIAKECCDTGLPLMRSLWIHYPHDPAAVACGDQFLWGRDLLVSPVVAKGATSRSLYLPAARGTTMAEEGRGGREIARAVDLERLPLQVRPAPSSPRSARSTRQPVVGGDPQTLVVYPGADGES